MKRIIYIILLALIGCAHSPPQMSRDEFLNMTTREYQNPKEEIFASIQTLFVLSDGDDYSFSYEDNKIIASHEYEAYAILYYIHGYHIWTIDVQETGSGVIVKATVTDQGGGFIGSIPYHTIMFHGVYDLFFSRLDYLLGRSKEWLTCKEAKVRYNTNMYEHLDAWCFFTKDDTPK